LQAEDYAEIRKLMEWLIKGEEETAMVDSKNVVDFYWDPV